MEEDVANNLSPRYTKYLEAEVTKIINSISTDFEKLQYLIWQVNEDKGFHTDTRTFGDCVALIHSELSEALEEYRKGHLPHEVYFVEDKDGKSKPEGVPIELSDAIIRILDVAKCYNIPNILKYVLMKELYNIGRSHMHGGKIL